jgi:hypothetical protein
VLRWYTLLYVFIKAQHEINAYLMCSSRSHLGNMLANHSIKPLTDMGPTASLLLHTPVVHVGNYSPCIHVMRPKYGLRVVK